MNLRLASSFNELLVNIILEELYRHKIDNYFISPGSRSTPLTTSVAYNDNLKKNIHFDERGAAFTALGYARATGKPGVLICTSGSAGANYFPAICEASADTVPMIIITADRPPELHDVLANQTYNQQNLFGEYVKGFYNIAPPDNNISLQNILQNICILIQKSLSNPVGPVHINCMFREPLTFKKIKQDYSAYTKEIQNWIDSGNPFTSIKRKKTDLSVRSKFDKAIPTILIVGALKTKKEAKIVLEFAEKYNLPIFPDIRSDLRMSNNSENLISYYDQILLAEVLEIDKPYQVIHVGGNIVSKRLLQFIEKSNIHKYYVLHNSKYAYNPHHKMTESNSGSLEKLLQELSKNLEPFNKKFLNKLSAYNKSVAMKISQFAFKFSEISIVRQLTESVNTNSFIYSSSSMSIRLLDMFAETTSFHTPVIANRGLSGIDGTIASAVGYAEGLKKRGTLLIGDLAFLHDINSLPLVKKTDYPLVIVLLNNNGGKIFSYLPIVKDVEIFREFFETPQNMTFQHTAKQYELPYYFISSSRQFKEIYLKAQKMNNSTIIEIACQDSDMLKEQKKIESILKKLIK